MNKRENQRMSMRIVLEALRENQRMSTRIVFEASRERAVVWRLDCCKHSYKVGDGAQNCKVLYSCLV